MLKRVLIGVACLALILPLLLPKLAALGRASRFQDLNGSSGKPLNNKSLLAPYDLSEGVYTLIVDKQAKQPDGSLSPNALRIDDQAALARYRDDILIEWSWWNLVPGERGKRPYLYLFRDDERVAGESADKAEHIKIPDALLALGRPVRLDTFQGPRAAYQEKLDQIRQAGQLIRVADPLDDLPYEHRFALRFPSIAVPDDQPFDYPAYVRTLIDRIAADLDTQDYRIAPPLPDEDPFYTGVTLMDSDQRYLRNAEHQPLRLTGIKLYDITLSVRSTPEAYARFQHLDLDRYVADHRNTALLVQAWLAATGAASAPAEIFLDPYESRGSLGRLSEDEYVVHYWTSVAD